MKQLFQQLHEAFTPSPVLVNINPAKQVVLVTVALSYAVAGINWQQAVNAHDGAQGTKRGKSKRRAERGH
jgi:hypothetical protein